MKNKKSLGMSRSSIILVTDGINAESWGSLKKFCNDAGYPIGYDSVKAKKMPFTYRGLTFNRLPFNMNAIEGLETIITYNR